MKNLRRIKNSTDLSIHFDNQKNHNVFILEPYLKHVARARYKNAPTHNLCNDCTKTKCVPCGHSRSYSRGPANFILITPSLSLLQFSIQILSVLSLPLAWPSVRVEALSVVDVRRFAGTRDNFRKKTL